MKPGERVPITQARDMLVPGEPLPFRIVDPLGRLLLAAGQRIADLGQLQALLDRGASVESEELARIRRERDERAGLAKVPSHRRTTWFDAWERQIWTLDRLLRALARGAVQGEELQDFVDGQLRLVEHQPDAALYMAVRQDEHRFALYALTHALNVAAVAVLTARLLGWPEPRVRSLASAAVTMNASIVELQAHMAEQSDPPSKRQLDEIRAHPGLSAQLLRAAGVDDPEWLAAVETHHERADGSGYPQGLKEVGETAHLLRAVDVFTAKISPRAFRAALRAQVAARHLFQEESGGPMAAALVKAVGVYPPGELVTLRSGDTGVVARRGQASNTPEVVVVLDARGRRPAEPKRHDTAQPEHAIVGLASLPAGALRVMPEQVYGLLEA